MSVISDHSHRSKFHRLFDHLVGQGEQLIRNLQAKRLRDAEIDDQFELGRLRYRKVGRFLTFEDTARVHADLAIGVGQMRSVTDESPGCSKLAPIVNRGKDMACRQCNDLIAPPEEVGIGTDDERAGSLVNERGKSGSHVMLPTGIHDNESLADDLRRGLHFAQVIPGFPTDCGFMR